MDVDVDVDVGLQGHLKTTNWPISSRSNEPRWLDEDASVQVQPQEAPLDPPSLLWAEEGGGGLSSSLLLVVG